MAGVIATLCMLGSPLVVLLDAHPAAADLTAPDLTEAWSKSYGTEFRLGAPTLADLDNDGSPEIIVGGHDGWVHVYRGDGTVLWEQPAVVQSGGPAVAIDAAPTVADIDGDGYKEVIVAAQSISVPNQSGGVVVFDHNGNVKWRWTTGHDIFNLWNPAAGTHGDGYVEGAVTSPAIGDIDGDGKPEIVIGALDNRIHVLKADGTELANWTSRLDWGYWVDDSVWSSPAVFDGDGDGKDEIYVGVAASSGGSIDHAGGVLLALGYDNGAPDIRWSAYTGEVVNSSPAIGDIDGDGRPEVVVGTGYDYANNDSRAVFAFHADDGSVVPGWPQYTNGATFSSPALGDLNGDGIPEVVIGTWPQPGAGTGDGKVYAFKGDGSVLWAVDPHQYVPQIKAWEGGGGIVGSPVLADVNGDGVTDVVVSNPWGTFTMNGRDGSRIWAPIRKGMTDENSPAVGKFGNAWRIILAGVTGAGSGAVVAVNLPSAPGVTPPWPQRHGTADHRGVFPNVLPQCPTLPRSEERRVGKEC
jgi:hypothetical protein